MGQNGPNPSAETDKSHVYTVRILLLIVILSSLSHNLSAQTTQQLHPASLTQSEINLVFKTTLPLRGWLLDQDAGFTQIQSRVVSGDFRTLQQPKTGSEYQFESYGLTSFRKIRLEGWFSYTKEQLNDVAWRLTRDVEHSPYYFANIRGGNWDNDLYAMKLGASSGLLNDKLVWALGIDYGVENLARYTDPRPTINFHKLHLRAQVGYQIGSNLVTLYAGKSDNTERGSVRNYNQSNDSFGRTEYNLITVNGVGSYNLVRRPTYEDLTDMVEGGLSWHSNLNSSTFDAELKLQRVETYFGRRGSSGSGAIYEEIGTFREWVIAANALYSRNLNQANLQIRSETQIKDGVDTNQLLGGSNYFRSNISQLFQVYWHPQNNKWSASVGTRWSLSNVDDRNASHSYQGQEVSTWIESRWSTSFNKFSIDVEPLAGITVPLNQAPNWNTTRENLYTTYVFLPEIMYYGSTRARFGGKIRVKVPFEAVSVSFVTSFVQERVIQQPEQRTTSSFFPGDTRNLFEFSIRFSQHD